MICRCLVFFNEFFAVLIKNLVQISITLSFSFMANGSISVVKFYDSFGTPKQIAVHIPANVLKSKKLMLICKRLLNELLGSD